MKIELFKDGIKIVPENELDEAYIRDTMLKKRPLVKLYQYAAADGGIYLEGRYDE